MNSIIFVSGLSFSTNNRGTQALGYGALPFLFKKKFLNKNDTVISPSFYKNPLKHLKNRKEEFRLNVENHSVKIIERKYWYYDIVFSELCFKIFKFFPFFTPYGRTIKKTKYISAICGGDGFSDIYSEHTMKDHSYWLLKAYNYKIPYIFLPQTIGPFSDLKNYGFAKHLLQNAYQVYVRDVAFNEELNKMNIEVKIENDLSYFMIPQKVSIKLPENKKIGLNISGLCYYNSFYNLTGKFDNYKKLLLQIVKTHQNKGVSIILIPHSYNHTVPEKFADDLEASRDFYNSLENKDNVILIEDDLKSPEIKYLISKMDFFIGSRLHSCFAAIFTKVPVFGLAYSYKYEHNFKKFNLPNNQYSVIDLKENDIPKILTLVENSEDYTLNQ